MRRLTQKEVERVFGLRGFTLNSNYIDSRTKLDVTCDKGHNIQIDYSNFRMGKGCAVCSGKAKKTIPELKSYFAKEGYTLLSTTYKNAHTDLDVLCPKGTHYKTTWNKYEQGSRCPCCVGGVRYTHAQIESMVQIENYTMRESYIKSSINLKLICPAGHNWDINLSSWNKGYRCTHCSGKKITLDVVRTRIESENYILVSKEYKSAKTKLDVICPVNHAYQVNLSDWVQGNRCPKCAKYGFQPNKPSILYYIRFDTKIGPLYKIGITNLSVKERFVGEQTPYVVLQQENFQTGEDAYKKEQLILSEHQQYKYKGDYLLQSGNTELFTKDVLGLDI